MSERPESGEHSAPAAPMPETAEPSQETPTVGSASPSFASDNDEARRPDADPSGSGVPTSSTEEAPKAAAAEPAETELAAAETELATAEAKLTIAETQQDSDHWKSLKAEADLLAEVEKLKTSVEKMQADAADRVENHRQQILGDLGIRKPEYMALAPEGDPVADDGKSIRDWALAHPELFKSSPALPTEKDQGSPQLGLLGKTRKTWRDAFGS